MSDRPKPTQRKTSDRISQLISRFEEPNNGIPLTSVSRALARTQPAATDSDGRNAFTLAPSVPIASTSKLDDHPVPRRKVLKGFVKPKITREAPLPDLHSVQTTSTKDTPLVQDRPQPARVEEEEEDETGDIAQLLPARNSKPRLEGAKRPLGSRSTSGRTVSFAPSTISISSGSSATLVGEEDASTKQTSPIYRRPALPPSRSSGALSSQTADIPAFDIFSRSAKPLELPALDEYLEAIPPFQFTDTSSVLSDEERIDWENWLKEPPESSWMWWKKKKPSNKSLLNTREKILPPMHLLPPSLTVADLQQNKTTPTPALSLDTALGTAVDAVLGAQGSSFGINLMNIEMFRDMAQMMALALTFFTRSPLSASNRYSSIFTVFSNVTSALGLDFSAFGKSLIWFGVFWVLAAFAVYEFYLMSGGWKGQVEAEDVGEGWDREDAMSREGKKGGLANWRDSRAYKICVVFIATSLYVPLTKISFNALVWSQDFWAFEGNPYATEDFPSWSSVDDPNVRQPSNFCYTTTMRKQNGLSNFNFAWIIIPIAASTLIWLALYFPIRLWQVIGQSVPRVDGFTEMGEKRSDLEVEYERQLQQDRNPLNFLYNCYRRRWSGFKSIYMAVKLANVICVTVFSKDTCLFRALERQKIDVVRQCVQLAMMTAFLLLQILASPNLDRITNNSDYVSRTGYVVIALIGLLAAVDTKRAPVLQGWVVLLVTGITYAFNTWFALLSFTFAQRIIKKLQKRIDSSLDLFSPSLDLAKHIARRVWQESFTTILLAEPRYRMPSKEPVVFASTEGAGPYLLGYRGYVGERHVENIKILREIGLQTYAESSATLNDRKAGHLRGVQQAILQNHTGPDCYFKPRHACNARSHWGRADVVPFPFAVIFRYDEHQEPLVILSAEEDLYLYLQLNQSEAVSEGRQVRLALRALEGQIIQAPYLQMQQIGSKLPLFTRAKHSYSLQSPTSFRRARLCIERNSALLWNGLALSSGFKVSLVYNDGVRQKGDGTTEYGCSLILDIEAFGFDKTFTISPLVATFLKANRPRIESRMTDVSEQLAYHRQHYAAKARHKAETLSYDFLLHVHGDAELGPNQLAQALDQEPNQEVRHLLESCPAAVLAMQERLACVNRSRVTQRWFLIFDDLWRRNKSTIPQIEACPASFSPHYRSSICYRPMSRPDLEQFFAEHNLSRKLFHAGWLNSIFFVLDETVFASTAAAVPLRIGSKHETVLYEELADKTHSSEEAQAGRCSLTMTTRTGESDAHDDDAIRSRPAFPFEQIYDLPQYHWRTGQRLAKVRQVVGGIRLAISIWLGLSPVVHDHRSPGVYLRLKLSREDHFVISKRPGHRALAADCQ